MIPPVTRTISPGRPKGFIGSLGFIEFIGFTPKAGPGDGLCRPRNRSLSHGLEDSALERVFRQGAGDGPQRSLPALALSQAPCDPLAPSQEAQAEMVAGRKRSSPEAGRQGTLTPQPMTTPAGRPVRGMVSAERATGPSPTDLRAQRLSVSSGKAQETALNGASLP